MLVKIRDFHINEIGKLQKNTCNMITILKNMCALVYVMQFSLYGTTSINYMQRNTPGERSPVYFQRISLGQGGRVG